MKFFTWQNERKNATSGNDIWLGPSAAKVTPACDPVTLKLAPEMIAISTWSYARVTNFANVEQNGIFPAAASPAAAEIMFCSAMRHSKNCAGNFLANHSA